MSPFEQLAPVCPECGKFAKQEPGRFGLKSSCCGLWSWNGKPLVDAETHRARIAAHNAFDPLWKNGQMTRTEAYRWLQKALRMSRQPHMAEMTAEEAWLVVRAVRNQA